MTRLCRRKKSDPRIGLDTSARQNGCLTLSSENFRSICAVPNVLMDEPLATTRLVLSGLVFFATGNTDMSAPVSTKNALLDSSSHTDSVPGGADVMILIWGKLPGAIAARRGRFPQRLASRYGA